MEPYTLHLGDCLDVLKRMPDASVDALVTDPPAGIAFLGHQWDRDKGGRTSWISWLTLVMTECRRVLRPGGSSLTWALPRTSHWTATAIEDAGWIIQDVITHHFGTGFPKHQNALKPASEHWVLAYKQGKRSLNIDSCRIATSLNDPNARANKDGALGTLKESYDGGLKNMGNGWGDTGRWPANVIFDEDAAAELDGQSGNCPSKDAAARGGYRAAGTKGTIDFKRGSRPSLPPGRGDTGGASRFFYVAKASRSERGVGNTHPTVKSLALMRYLCRLITPPGGTVLDPFMGSGSTGIAALTEGFRFLGMEQEPEYFAIAQRRIAAAAPTLFGVEAAG